MTRLLAGLLALGAAVALVTAFVVSRHQADARAQVQRPVPAALGPDSSGPSALGTSTSRTSGSGPARELAVPRGFPWTTDRNELVAPVRPRQLFVPAIGVDTTVGAKPTQRELDPFLHRTVASFGVPDDMVSTTWWSSGPRPGDPGMAVVLGHTQINGYGVFNRLGRLRPGDVVGVEGGGTTLRFRVIEVRRGIPKTDPTALATTLAHHPAAARLALLTCSGSFDEGLRASSENTVVFAALVSAG